MQPELRPDTRLFAGRYIITGTANVNPYGFTYQATDQSNGSRVYVQEFFPHSGCHRNADTLDMAIRKEEAAGVSAMYKEFTQYVSRLKDNDIADAQQLIHAFKDHGTAYYVTANDDSDKLSGLKRPLSASPQPQHAATPAPAPRPRPSRTKDASDMHGSSHTSHDSRKKLTPAEASLRNAILWYRIVIFLLVCIVLLLVYLNFLSPSPKVKSAHTIQPADIENIADTIAVQ